MGKLRSGNLPICSTCGRRGTFPPITDGSDTLRYEQHRTSHGYAYCWVCAGAWTRAQAPDGEYVVPFPVPPFPPFPDDHADEVSR